MKIVVCGPSGHGKDTFCEMLRMPFASSSKQVLPHVFNSEFGKGYFSSSDCYLDRHNHREFWFNFIRNYNSPDKTRLAREIFEDSDVYCGMRCREEFYANLLDGTFDLSIWVDANGRDGLGPESSRSCTITASDCDVTVLNDESLISLARKAATIKRLADSFIPGFFDETETIGQLIIGWADQVFPDRTITNAISKLVLEEIPEYLNNRTDPMELADLGILVYDIANLAGVDLDSAIRKKMAINKERSWYIDPETGLMKHEKEKPNG